MLALNLPAQIFVEESERIEAAFLDACEWLKSLGVFPASNRFTTYARLLKDFRLGKKELMQSEDGLRHYVNALAESSELLRIRKSMQVIDSDSYLNQLRKITSGSAFKAAVGADPARDFAFELSIASRFLAAGYPVDVTSIADSVVHVEKCRLYIECKRVQSASKVMIRLREARDQIALRLQADHSSKSRGLVACRITDVLNPEARHAVFPKAEDFRRKSEIALQEYVVANESDLKSRIGKKQLGILFESSLYGVVYAEKDPKSAPAFMNCRGATFYYSGLGTQDTELVTSLAPNLSNNNVL